MAAEGKNMYERCELVGVAQPPANDKTGVSSGYYGSLEGKHYAPCFALPDEKFYLTFRLHNVLDQSGDVYLILISIFSETEQYLDVFKVSLDAYGYADISLTPSKRGAHILIMEVGWETTEPESSEPPYVRRVYYKEEGRWINVLITHRQTLAIHVGESAVSEEAGSEDDVCYYQCELGYLKDPNKPYPIIGSIRIFVEHAPPYFAIPTLRFNGRKEGVATIRLRNFARSAKKKYSGKYTWSTAKEKGDFETTFDAEIGFDESADTLYHARTTIKTDFYDRVILYAVGRSPEWWEFWNWKADDAHIFVIGDPPSYVEAEVRWAVSRIGLPSDEDLLKTMEQFEREAISYGMPLYATRIAFEASASGWGGFATIKATGPAFEKSPAVLAALTPGMIQFILGALTVIGIMVTAYFAVIKPIFVDREFPYQSPVPGDNRRFKTYQELLMYLDLTYGEELAKKWIPERDPFTGEELPEDAKKSLYAYDQYMSAKHPDEWREIKRELGVEGEFNIMPLIGYTAAAVVIYVAGGFLPKKFEKVKALAVIPGMLAAWEGYKLFSQILPGGE